MIGERLKQLRKEHKLSQEELASILGMQTSSISAYELDRIDPSDKIKIKIARYFNISLDYLLGIIDDPIPCYNKKFFFVPFHMTKEEKFLLSEFINYLKIKRKNNSPPKTKSESSKNTKNNADS